MANVYFWLNQDTSYFAAASSELPLLHLWSLGVEEQFYIVWPLLLMLLPRLRSARVLFAVAVAAAAASFLLGQFLYERSPLFTYYMLPTRAGELLMGALVALLVLRNAGARIPRAAATPMALVGALLILSSLALLSEDQVFPGLLAIPPTLGTALLILSGYCARSNPLARLLAWRPMVGIGLISYSAYLWHWPLLAFYRYGHAEIGLLAGASIFALTLLLAWLSYLFIETPARHSAAPALRIFLGHFIVPAAVVGAIALGAHFSAGYGGRWLVPDYKAQLAALRAQTRPAFLYDYVCQRQLLRPADATNERCLIGTEGNGGSGTPIPAPQAILWGDSNASHYVGMVGAFAKQEGFRFRNLAVGACPPLATDAQAFAQAPRLANCRESTPIAWEAVQRHAVVIISAAWNSYQERSPQFLDTFFSTVRSLTQQGKLVILLGKIPVIAGYDRLCAEKALGYPALSCPEARAPIGADVAAVNARLREFAQQTPGVRYFDPTPYLCPQGECSASGQDGVPLYFDPSHLTLQASWLLGERILRAEGVPPAFASIAGRHSVASAVRP